MAQLGTSSRSYQSVSSLTSLADHQAKAVDYYMKQETKSLRNGGSSFNLSKSQLQRRVLSSSVRAWSGRPPVLTEKEEEKVVEWILLFHQYGRCLDRSQISAKVAQYAAA